MIGVARRAPVKVGVKWLLIANGAIYLGTLLWSYFTGLSPTGHGDNLLLFGLSWDGITELRIWGLFTYMWLHDVNVITHIGFNLLVLFWFGPEFEAQWGTKRFLQRYVIYGLGGGVAVVLTGLVFSLFGGSRPPTVGASAAISGLLMVFCLQTWRSTLTIFVLQFKGRTLFIVLIVLDLVRLVGGDPIAVEAHWGGYLTAYLIEEGDQFHPKLLRLRLKRWRLKRKLRLEPGGNGANKGNGDARYLH